MPMIVQIENNVTDLIDVEIEAAIESAATMTISSFDFAAELERMCLIPKLSILLTGSEEIRRLNQQFRRINEVTDVLSFSALPMVEGRLAGSVQVWDLEVIGNSKFLNLGDIVICPEQAASQASEHNHSLPEEMLFLLVHGILHLLGYDHEDGFAAERMFILQEEMMRKLDFPRFRSGFVSIIGRPNVGKSTLLNRLIGTKVSIISPKPQTTQKMIRGVYTDNEAQIIFLDTPGVHQPTSRLGQYMLQAAEQAFMESDLICLMIEAGFKPFIDRIERNILDKAVEMNKPVIIVINKTDTAKKENLLPLIALYNQEYGFTSFIPISAKYGDGVSLLIQEIKQKLPISQPNYDESDYTDQTERMLAAELIREALFNRLHEELPYGIAVMIEEYNEIFDSAGDRTRITISAAVLTEKESHKRIILGKGGNMIKNIGIKARQELELMADCPVDLYLFVKVRADWRNKPHHLQELDFDSKQFS